MGGRTWPVIDVQVLIERRKVTNKEGDELERAQTASFTNLYNTN